MRMKLAESAGKSGLNRQSPISLAPVALGSYHERTGSYNLISAHIHKGGDWSMNTLAFLMQQSDNTGNPAAAAGMGVFAVVWLALAILMIAALWKIFVKAGEPGWAAIVPIYNMIVILTIVGKPLWWIILFLIPFVNLIVAFVVVFDLAKAFGKGAGFALGMVFLGPIFYPMLAWGDAQYRAPAAA